MKNVTPMITSSGERYDIPDDQREAFAADFGDSAQPVRKYRTSDGDYDIPEDKAADFVKDYPDAKPIRTLRFNNGETRSFTPDELQKFLVTEVLDNPAYKSDIEEDEARRKAEEQEQQKAESDRIRKAVEESGGDEGKLEEILYGDIAKRDPGTAEWLAKRKEARANIARMRDEIAAASPFMDGLKAAGRELHAHVSEGINRAVTPWSSKVSGLVKETGLLLSSFGADSAGNAVVDVGRDIDKWTHILFRPDLAEEESVVSSTVNKGVGVMSEIGSWWAALKVGGSYGVAGLTLSANANSYVDLYDTATARGASPQEAGRIATLGGVGDAAVTMAFAAAPVHRIASAFGFSGEKFAAKTVKEAAGKGWQAIKRAIGWGAGKQMLANAAVSAMEVGGLSAVSRGFDEAMQEEARGEPLNWEKIRDAVKEGGIEGGAIGGILALLPTPAKIRETIKAAERTLSSLPHSVEGREILKNNAPDALADFLEAYEKGGAPSRKQLNDIGVPDSAAPTAADRVKLAKLFEMGGYKSKDLRTGKINPEGSIEVEATVVPDQPAPAEPSKGEVVPVEPKPAEKPVEPVKPPEKPVETPPVPAEPPKPPAETPKNGPVSVPPPEGTTTPPESAEQPHGGGSAENAAPVLSGDEVRKTMPGYDPKDWRTHVDKTGYVAPRMEAEFQRLLKDRKGKGNGEVVFLAGGNGSGKSTVANAEGAEADFIIDSTLGNLEVAKKQIEAVLSNGQKPAIDFVYRTPEQALKGVVERVENGGHAVSPLSFADSHTKGIKNLRLLADEYGDKIAIRIFDNSVEGMPRLTLEQLEAKGIPDHAELRAKANEVLGQYGGLARQVGARSVDGSGAEVEGAQGGEGRETGGTGDVEPPAPPAPAPVNKGKVPAKKPKPAKADPKKAAKAVEGFVATDPTRKTLMNVHHDHEGGVAVATDGRVLIATKHGYDKNAKDDPEAPYPNWRQVIPDYDGATYTAIDRSTVDKSGRTVTKKVELPVHTLETDPAAVSSACKKAASLAKAVGHDGAVYASLELPDGGRIMMDPAYLRKVADAMGANGITEIRAVAPNRPIVAKNDDTTIVAMPLRRGSTDSPTGRLYGNALIIDALTGRILSAPERSDTTATTSRKWADERRKDIERGKKEAMAEARKRDLFKNVAEAWKRGETDAKAVFDGYSGEGEWDKLSPSSRAQFEEWFALKDENALAEKIAEHFAEQFPDLNPWHKKIPKEVAKIEKRIAAEDEIDALMAEPAQPKPAGTDGEWTREEYERYLKRNHMKDAPGKFEKWRAGKEKSAAAKKSMVQGSPDAASPLRPAPKGAKLVQGEFDGMGGEEVRTDRQGNPIDADGRLIIEPVGKVSDVTDDDFAKPTRNVQLPKIPDNVDAAIGANGKPVVIKKNIFEKNAAHHPELDGETSRSILERSLYNPDLVGQSQPRTKPYYRVAIQTGDGNAVTILDVHETRDNVKVVGWRNIDEKGFERLKRQAAREGGQFLILHPSEEGQPGALSGRPSGSATVPVDKTSRSAEMIPRPGGEVKGGAENSQKTKKTPDPQNAARNPAALRDPAFVKWAKSKGRAPTPFARRAYDAAQLRAAVPLYRNVFPDMNIVIHDKVEDPAKWTADHPDGTQKMIGGVGGASNMGIKGAADAEALEKAGKDREEIWRKTGWWRAKDGKWRFELPSTKMKDARALYSALIEGNNETTLEKILDAPELFKAYPQLKDMKIILSPEEVNPGESGGWYDRIKNEIVLLDAGIVSLKDMPARERDLRDTYQKVLDSDEFVRRRFADMDAFGIEHGTVEDEREYARWWIERQDKGINRTNETRVRDLANDRRVWSVFGKIIHEVQHAVQRIEGFARGASGEEDGYRRFGGEVEARNAARREAMSPEERAATPPWASEDVAEGTQIIRRMIVDPKSGEVLGWYTPQFKEVHLNPGATVETLAHEMLHAVQDWAKTNSPKLAKALDDIARDCPERLRKRIMRAYGVVSPETIMKEWGAFNFMGGPEGGKGRGGEALRDELAKRENAAWLGRFWSAAKDAWRDMAAKMGGNRIDLDAIDSKTPQEAMDFLARAFAEGGTVGKANPPGKSVRPAIDMTKPLSLAEKWDVNLHDYRSPLKWLRDEMAKRGSSFKDDTDFYEAARLQKGYDQAAVNDADRRLKEYTGKLKKLGVKHEEVVEFMQAQAAKDRNAMIREKFGREDGSGMTDAEAAATLKAFDDAGKGDALCEISNFLLDMQREGLQYRVETGLLSAEDAQRMADREPFHVPFRSAVDPETGDYVQWGSDKALEKAEFKEAKGRKTLADDVVGWMFSEFIDAHTRGNENRIRKMVADAMRLNAKSGVGKILKGARKQSAYDFSAGEYKTGANGDGLTGDKAKAAIVDDPRFRESRKNGDGGRKNVLAFKEGGRTHYIEFAEGERGERLQAAVNGRDLKSMGKLWKTGMRFWSSTATEWAPTFALRNFAADNIDVFGNYIGEHGIVKGSASYARHLKNAAELTPAITRYIATGDIPQGVGGEWIRRYEQSGGLIAGYASEGYGEITSKIDAEIAKSGRSKGAVIARNVALAVPHAVAAVNRYAELLTRVSAFRTQCENGMTDHKAALWSRESTVDFNMIGNLTGISNGLWMFSNSTLGASTRQLVSLAGKYGLSVAAAFAGYGIIEAILEILMNGDDDEREAKGEGSGKDVSEYTRANSLYWRRGGKVYRVPFHAGPFSLIKYAGNCAARVAFGKMKLEDAAKELRAEALSQLFHYTGVGDVNMRSQSGRFADDAATFAGTAAPSLAQPLVQGAFNIDYAGRSIYNEGFPGDKTPRSAQGRRTTPGWAKDAAAWLNEATRSEGHETGYIDLPPEIIKMAGEAVGKNLLRDVMNAWTVGTMAFGDEKYDVRNVPVARDFVREVDGNDRRYNDARKEYEANASYLKRHAAEMSNEEREAYVKKFPHARFVAKGKQTLDALETEIRRLRKMEDGYFFKKGKATRYEWPQEKLDEFRAKRRELQAKFLKAMGM